MPHRDQPTAAALPPTAARPNELTSATQIVHPDLRDLFNLWDQKRGLRTAPARADLKVEELKTWLPHLQLVDLTEDGSDIRYRVIGTWIVERFGKDDTGRSMAEIGLTSESREVLNEFLVTAQTMRPRISVRPFYGQEGAREYTRSERLLLPLSTDGHSCDKLLSGIYYLGEDP